MEAACGAAEVTGAAPAALGKALQLIDPGDDSVLPHRPFPGISFEGDHRVEGIGEVEL